MASTDICRFISNEIFELCADGSDTTYKIHKGLFKAKMGITATGFREDEENRYVFEATTPMTILKFIEWAYKDDYSFAPMKDKAGDGADKPTGRIVHKDGNTGIKDDDVVNEDNELLCHAHIYVFAETYLMLPLRDLAFSKITSMVENNWELLQVPTEKEIIPSLMPVLAMCYEDRLPSGDTLLEWLGKYTAWRIETFLEQPAFLQTLAQMLPYVVKHLQAGPLPPWRDVRVTKPKTVGKKRKFNRKSVKGRKPTPRPSSSSSSYSGSE